MIKFQEVLNKIEQYQENIRGEEDVRDIWTFE
jgi:hypothetical protein